MADDARDASGAAETEATAVETDAESGVAARYDEVDGERVLAFEREGRTAAVAQNADGYATLKVRERADGAELERYYGFEMALDHAAELLGVGVGDLPVPEPAADMGM